MTTSPPVVPPELWNTPAMRTALKTRDVATIIRLTRKHTGASQTRIGELLGGVTQAEISTIERGHRIVTDLTMFERLANGLTMPNHARTTLGLAETPSFIAARIGFGEPAAVDRFGGEAPGPIDAVYDYLVFDDGGRNPETAGNRLSAVAQEVGSSMSVVASELRGLDGRIPSVELLAICRYQLGFADRLLNHCPMSEEDRQRLVMATGELHRLAGWYAFDIGQDLVSQKHTIAALRRVSEAGTGKRRYISVPS
jgi:transcriptional regulator with XRE-family HTH domain